MHFAVVTEFARLANRPALALGQRISISGEAELRALWAPRTGRPACHVQERQFPLLPPTPAWLSAVPERARFGPFRHCMPDPAPTPVSGTVPVANPAKASREVAASGTSSPARGAGSPPEQIAANHPDSPAAREHPGQKYPGRSGKYDRTDQRQLQQGIRCILDRQPHGGPDRRVLVDASTASCNTKTAHSATPTTNSTSGPSPGCRK